MRIIIANYRYFVAGGPEKYMFKFIDAAEKRGIEVIPFSVNIPQNLETPYSKYFAKPRSKQLMYEDTKSTLVNYWGMLRAIVWNWNAERCLRKMIRDTKPDVVYILHEVNHLSPSIIRAAKKEGVRVVHRVSDFFMFCPKYDFLCEDDICESCMHGDYSKAILYRCFKDSNLGTRLRVLAMKLYAKTKVFDDVNKFICTCEFTKNKLVEGGISSDRIECIPTFIDTSQINPCYEDEHYFLFLGRMVRQKGTVYAIEAMKYLKDTEYVLKITGMLSESKEDSIIRKYIVENGLEEKVIFTGFKSGKELDDLINKSTCIVCPAIWYENMPNAVIEAYAHGKPVVASRVGSLADLVVDGKTGYLFEMKNSKDMADKLNKFVENSDLSKKIGRQAREECEIKYSEELHMSCLIKHLNG